MNAQETKASLITIVENNIATVEFGHPASNSFPQSLLELLTAQINTLSVDDNVTLIVLKSKGNAVFCAGASFDELLEVSNAAEGMAFFSGFAHLINAMRKCSKLIIGRIHGKAVGGGVGIAAACDYAFASEAASVKLSELAIGMGPFVIEPAVSRKIGKTATVEMTLNAHQWKSAAWAQEKGLYAAVFETTELLDTAITDFSLKLASYSTDSLKEIKKMFWEGTEHWDTLLLERAAVSGELVLSDFTRKALEQFKRK